MKLFRFLQIIFERRGPEKGNVFVVVAEFRILSTSKFLRKTGNYRSSGPVGRIVSNGAHPVCSPVICTPIEQRAEEGYLLVSIVSSGCHAGLYIVVSFSSECPRLGPCPG